VQQNWSKPTKNQNWVQCSFISISFHRIQQFPSPSECNAAVLTLAPAPPSSVIKSTQTATLLPCAYKRGPGIPSLTTPSTLLFPGSKFLVVFHGEQICSLSTLWWGFCHSVYSWLLVWYVLIFTFFSFAWPCDHIVTGTPSLLPHQTYSALPQCRTCRRNLVGSLLRGMSTVVDESVEEPDGDTSAETSDLDRFRPSDWHNTLRHVSSMDCIEYEMHSRGVSTRLI